MKIMRLVRSMKIGVPANVKEGDEPYNKVHELPEHTIVEVLSELDGKFQVESGDIEFEVSKADLFIPKGQLMTVLRRADGYDGTLKGITSRYSEVILCGEGIDQIFEETERTPAMRVWTRDLGKDRNSRYSVAVPYGPNHYAFGGHFLHSSDSRITKSLPPYGILPVHDRDMRRETR